MDETVSATKPIISWEQFAQVDIRVGKIIEVADFPEARNPSYKLMIDFGKRIGVKKSCAQLPVNYRKADLLGTKIAAVVNFAPKQVGPAISEVLVVGFPDDKGNAVIVHPDQEVPLGGMLF